LGLRQFVFVIGGVSEVGDHLGVSNAAASQMVDRLVQQGLLERVESPADRRMKQLTLTARGRALVEKAKARHAWTATLAPALTREQPAVIITALGYLMEAARAREEDSERRK
jgi:DNA-binding MarR family transcriptional regulator